MTRRIKAFDEAAAKHLVATAPAVIRHQEHEIAAIGRILRREEPVHAAHLRETVMEQILRDEETTIHGRLTKLRERIAGNEQEIQGMRKNFNQLMPEFEGKWLEVDRRSKLVPVPPGTSTANNMEATFMAYSYVFEPIAGKFSSFPEDQQNDAVSAASSMASYLVGKTPSVNRIVTRMMEAAKPYDDDTVSTAQAFAIMWFNAGFPKLEVGHKLAASLALTDAPDDVEVKAPWGAWSIVVPPGLFGDEDPQYPGESVARVWCVGSEPRFFVSHNGQLMGPLSRDVIHRDSPYERGRAVALALEALVRGCCLCLSNPDDYRRQKLGSSSSSSKKSSREHESPDFSTTRFMLSAPVTVDLRDHLRDVIAGRKHGGGGGAPTVQFMVRGHWKNQAHGPRHSLRKQIWIQPFWKGDESARVLLRNYKVRTDEDS